MDFSSSIPWLSELEMEDSILTDDYEQSTELMIAAFVEGLQQTLSSESNSSSPTLDIKNSDSTVNAYMEDQRRLKQRRTTMEHKNSEPLILSFNNPDFLRNSEYNKEDIAGFSRDLSSSSPVFQYSKHPFHANQEDEIIFGQWSKNTTSTTKPASQLRDHVIAERKRRENLNKLFIALSTIVPGLKKTDKSSVLGETIKYIKQLQEKEKKLEVQSRKKAIEQVVIVRKSKVVVDEDDQNDCSNEISDDNKEEWLPHIEAKVSGNNVLLRLHCKKQKGVLAKTLTEIEKFNLKVINSCAVPFGELSLDVTVMAQMEKESCAGLIKGLVRSLRSALQH
nr:transcription factor bHLH19 [Ziziphus jujuba var. spinosa]XP_048335289.1 transcription factor bHLH19 [Ziziphus jujuba var. spinosa]